MKRETPNGVLADAAEVEGAIVFEDVGDFGVAVGGGVLQIFDDVTALVEAEDEGVALGGWLEEFGETHYYLA